MDSKQPTGEPQSHTSKVDVPTTDKPLTTAKTSKNKPPVNLLEESLPQVNGTIDLGGAAGSTDGTDPPRKPRTRKTVAADRKLTQ